MFGKGVTGAMRGGCVLAGRGGCIGFALWPLSCLCPAQEARAIETNTNLLQTYCEHKPIARTQSYCISESYTRNRAIGIPIASRQSYCKHKPIATHPKCIAPTHENLLHVRMLEPRSQRQMRAECQCACAATVWEAHSWNNAAVSCQSV